VLAGATPEGRTSFLEADLATYTELYKNKALKMERLLGHP
jgi:hypothetical protein